MKRMTRFVRPSTAAALAALLTLPAAALSARDARGARSESPGSAAARLQARPAQPAPDVDAALLMRDVEVLAADDMQGRRVGTPGHARARAYVLSRFEAIGLKPLTDTYEHAFTFTGRGSPAAQEGVNLLGLIRGARQPARVIVITAHYDHIGVRNGDVFNGADDNATGVAALLAVAAHFIRHPAETSLVIAALDAEESGLRGARAFLASGVVAKDAIAMNVNLDMLGRDAQNVLYAAGTHHYPDLKPLLEGAAQPPVDLRLGHDVPGTTAEDWTSASDHAPFHQAGIPFIYFGVEDFEHHHKASDEAATIQREFFAGVVRTIIVAVERLAGHAAGATR